MSGFLSLQRAMDFSIIEEMNSSLKLDDFKVMLKRFPEPKSRHDPFVSILQEQLPLIIMLSFIVSAPAICKDIVLEKEKKLKVFKALITFYSRITDRSEQLNPISNLKVISVMIDLY